MAQHNSITKGESSMGLKNITGWRRKLFNLKVKLAVLIHFLPEILPGRLGPKKFTAFCRRLLYFLSKIQDNKFAQINEGVKLDLYVPEFPSRAFYTACEKFKEFDDKLPCTTALISITSACRFECEHCYQRLDKGADVDLDVLIEIVQELQEKGIAFFNIEGGDPFLRYERLQRVCAAIDDRSEIWVNSTGDGMTKERLRELKELGVKAVMFSVHSTEPEELNQFMGRSDAWQIMEQGIELCHQVGIAPTINTCLGTEAFADGKFEAIMEFAKDRNIPLIQIIVPKPAGAWLENQEELFKTNQEIKEKIFKYNLDPAYQDYPAISAQAIEEDSDHFGCTAGGTDRFYINAKGDLQPCEFLNISFGNISEDDFEEIYDQMRNCFDPPGQCWVCQEKAEQVLELYEEHDLDRLPLPPELAEEVYCNLDTGSETELYQQIEKMK